MPHRPLRILTWHVHGNYLYYLTQVPHQWYVLSKPGRPPGYAGRAGALPWGPNVHDMPLDQVRDLDFDVVLYQSHAHYLDRHQVLGERQLRAPQVYLEHDPPQEHPTDTRHPVQDREALLVHVTHFNELMWDNGETPTRVVEHGVLVPPGVRYRGDKARGIVVVNNMKKRGRRLGADLFREARRHVPLDLVGMDAESEEGGLGEVVNVEVPAFISQYRFFFHTCRYTSLGLAACEAMMIGMPVVAPATTEIVTVIRNGENGCIDTDRAALIECMQELVRDPARARRLGDAARETAAARFNIERFVADWMEVLELAMDGRGGQRAAA